MQNRRPKIWISVLIVLTAAALVFTFAGASAVKADADNVEYVQAASFGDPSAAEGINVRFNNYAEGNGTLRWMTDLSVSEGTEKISVSHEYPARRNVSQVEAFKDEIQIYPYLYNDPKLNEYAKEIAGDLKAGESKGVEIRLADYIDSIPVAANYAVGTSYYGSEMSFNDKTKETELTDKVNEALSKVFGVKVPDGMTASMNVYRRADAGGELSYDFYVMDFVLNGKAMAAYFDCLARGQYFEGAYYVYVYQQSSLEERGLVLLPDGSMSCKVVRIPVTENGKTPDNHPWYELDTDNITVTADLGDDFKTLQHSLIDGGTKALVCGTSGGRVRAYIVDFAAGGTVRTIDICAEAEHCSILFKGDWFVLDVPGEGYYVVHPQGGTYSVFFAPTDGSVEKAEVKRNEQWRNGNATFDADFSDGRLAVASFAGRTIENVVNGRTYEGFAGSGISLAVYTQAGLRYYTMYESDLFRLQYPILSEYMCSVEIR